MGCSSYPHRRIENQHSDTQCVCLVRLQGISRHLALKCFPTSCRKQPRQADCRHQGMRLYTHERLSYSLNPYHNFPTNDLLCSFANVIPRSCVYSQRHCWSKPIGTYHDLSSYFLRWRGFAHRLVNRRPRAWDYESPTRQERKVLPFLKLQPLRIFYDFPFLNILSHCVVVVC